MGSMNQGSGPGVKGIGKDSTAGARGRVGGDDAANPNSFGHGSGVSNARGGAPNAAYPQGSVSKRADSGPPVTGSTTDGSPGGEGGVKSVKASSAGRGSPGAAPAPASARRLTPVGGAPESQNSMNQASMRDMTPPDAQQMANRRGFMGARPDGRPPGAEEPA